MDRYDVSRSQPALSYYKSTMRCSKAARTSSDPSSNPCIDAACPAFCCSSSASLVCASLILPAAALKG